MKVGEKDSDIFGEMFYYIFDFSMESNYLDNE